MSSFVTVVAVGHPVNYWFLKLAAYPVISIADGPSERLSWGAPGRQVPVEPGPSEIRFRLYYRGIPRPVAASSTTVEIGRDESVRLVVRNGWSNQHPFTFEKVGASSGG